MSLLYVDAHDPAMTPDGPFLPNPLNTACFLLTATSTVATFAANYRGAPYMEELVCNRLLLRTLQGAAAVLAVGAAEVFEPLNQLLQLAPLAGGRADGGTCGGDGVGALAVVADALGLRACLCAVMVLDVAVTFAVERGIIYCFEG